MFERVFGCDYRSLAAFRIAMGIVLIWDLVFRFPTLVEMYTDQGFFTRELAYDYQHFRAGEGWHESVWSFHWMSGSPEFQTVLFVLAGIAGLMLTFGYWTRIATIVSWAFLVSLHNRNPVIISSGDFLLKMMLFWSIFVPLGRVWSVDAWLRTRKKVESSLPAVGNYVSVATAALVVQLFLMYFFSGVAKWNEDWWGGDAMYYVLHLDIFVNDFGKQMLEYPLMLKFITLGTLLAEVFLIWTLFSPKFNGRFRMLNLIVFWGFHIGIGLSMSIGLFPIICMACWLPLLPSWIWDFFSKRETAESDQPSPDVSNRTPVYIATQVFCAVTLAYVVLWNVINVESLGLREKFARDFFRPGLILNLEQHFQMFGRPPRTNPWFVYEATLTDGRMVDLYSGKPLTEEHIKTESAREAMPNFHWRRLHRNLVGQREELRQPMGEYFVRHWNETHGEDEQVRRFKLLCYLTETGPDFNELSNHSSVWSKWPLVEEEAAGSLFDAQLQRLEDGEEIEIGGLGF